jgi:starch synthase
VQIAVRPAFDERFLRQCLAGADILLLPAADEMAEQLVMLALRYGAVPLAQRGASLTDVLIDAERPRSSTGFGFIDYNSGTLLPAMSRALAAYRLPDRWRGLQRRGMRLAQQMSRAGAAQAHLALYQQARDRRKALVDQKAQTLDVDLNRVGGVQPIG